MNPVSQRVDPIGREDPVVRAAAELLRLRLKLVRQRFSQAARCGGDVEKIHQLRVATRRVSAALDLFRELLPRKAAKKIARLQGRIRRAAGKIRDCDLLLARFDEPAANGQSVPLVARIRERRQKAYESLCAVHRKYVVSGEMKRRTKTLLRKTRRKDQRHADSVSERFSQWCPARLQSCLADFFEAAAPSLDDFSQLHRFRIRAKALRYAIELVAPAFARELSTELYPEVERLQTLLGEINDESTILAALGKEVADDRTACYAEELERQIARARQAIREREDAYAAWWTPERREQLKRRFQELVAAPRSAQARP
jgi:CHAD domain-containing protein